VGPGALFRFEANVATPIIDGRARRTKIEALNMIIVEFSRRRFPVKLENNLMKLRLRRIAYLLVGAISQDRKSSHEFWTMPKQALDGDRYRNSLQ